MLRTYSVRVFGCKVNQYEACQIEALLQSAGLISAARGEQADLCVVHGCAVTRTALVKSSRQAPAFARNGSRLMVTGCASSAPDAGGAFPETALRVSSGPGWVEAFCEILDNLPVPKPVPTAARLLGGPGLETFSRHSRAFLKIQDGCDLGCTYCIVPKLRGPSRERPLNAIRKEAECLARNGYAELVITGVSVGLFGRKGPDSLVDVLQVVTAVPGVKRVRLSSLHPAEVTNNLLEFWASNPRMAPHIHLPLQSGSDAVLARMRRTYTANAYRAAVMRARKMLNAPTFSADVLVGFPGETEDDFEKTLSFCRNMGFVRLHVFPFSPRPNTPAFRMKPRVETARVRARAARLRDLAEALAHRAHQSAVGRSAEVLCEVRDRKTGTWRGYSERYLPMRFPGPPGWAGHIVHVIPNAADARFVRLDQTPALT